MLKWYYQIKGKLPEPTTSGFGGVSNWAWPPLFVGMVEAENRKLAINEVNNQYSKNFPCRVLAKDLDNHNFLLHIQEVKETDKHILELFDVRSCQHCGNTFKIIDKYNDINQSYKGRDYCSFDCKNEAYEIQRFISTNDNELNGIHPPVIYRIYNVHTGMSYVGKTTQAFTLRWYQHFFQSSDTKFHKAVKGTTLEDWVFQVVEKVFIPSDIKSKSDIEKLIFERERHWINKLDCVKNGYNSL